MSNVTVTGAIYGKGRDEDVSNSLKFSSAGNAWLAFKVAAYGGKDMDGNTKDKVYWDCIAFGDLAEHLAESCKNGDNVIVNGTIESNNWEKDDGTKVWGSQIKVWEAGVSLRWNNANPVRTERSEGTGYKAPAPTKVDDDLNW